jgi:hypothetical protein
MLTTNLEPVYGIIWRILLLVERKMSFSFYVGAVIIIITVILGLSNTRPVKKSGNYG